MAGLASGFLLGVANRDGTLVTSYFGERESSFLCERVFLKEVLYVRCFLGTSMWCVSRVSCTHLGSSRWAP